MRDILKAVVAAHGHFFYKSAPGSVSILMYHRVTGDLPVELDLPFEIFKRQLTWLAEEGNVVPYREAVNRLLEGQNGNHRHTYAITFDDAYRDFYTHAWPLLRALNLPATLFVPTRFIDEPAHLPLSRAVPGAHTKLQPMTWEQLREVAEDPLITIGSHTHNHPDLIKLSELQIADEMTQAASRFEAELGWVPADFAYPRGLWNERVQHVIAAYCETAAIVGGEIAQVASTARYAVPRVPIRRSDGWRWFEPRIKGDLAGEEKVIRLAKRVLGGVRGY